MTRYFFFRSGRFFHQFLELGFTAYPSPLEQDAPLFAKLILLAFVGGVEFTVASWAADIAGIFIFLLLAIIDWAFGSSLLEYISTEVCKDIVLYSLLAAEFVWRAKSLWKSATRYGIIFHDLVVAFIWHNPTLMVFTLFRTWARCTGTEPIRPLSPRFVWILLAPTLELGLAQLDATNKNQNWNFFSEIWTLIKITVLAQVVKTGPAATTHLILGIHNFTHICFERRTEKHYKDKVITPRSSMLRWSISTMTRIDNLISSMLEMMLFALRRVYGNCLDKAASRRWRNEMTDTVKDIYRSGWQEQASDGVRLLTILPGTGDGLINPIRCSLQWETLNSCPNYIAMSYRWGDDRRSEVILVDGKPMSVTKSAFELLRNMRSMVKPQTVWIDFICINQDDTQDKNRQIPLMSRIYQQANRVIVYLGESDTAEQATALVNRLFLINRMSHTGSRREFYYEIARDSAHALKTMLGCEWFGRVWIIQEVVQARGKVDIHYGSATLDWERFSWFTQTLSTDTKLLNMLSARIGGLGLAESRVLSNVSLLRRFSRVSDDTTSLPCYDWNSRGLGQTTIQQTNLAMDGISAHRGLSLIFYLAQTFRTSGSFTSWLPHDRIYGLLGLSSCQKTHLVPDYNSSLRQLYINVVRNALETSRDEFKLEFLNHAGSGYQDAEDSTHNLTDLPSWVPNWSLKTKARPMFGTEGGSELLRTRNLGGLLDDAANLMSFATFDGDAENKPAAGSSRNEALERVRQVKQTMLNSLFNAGPKLEQQVDYIPMNDTLRLRGYRFDRIRRVGRTFPDFNDSILSTEPMEVMAQWTDLAQEEETRITPNLAQGHTLPQTFMMVLNHDTTLAKIDYTFSIGADRASKNIYCKTSSGPAGMWKVWRERIWKNWPTTTTAAHAATWIKLNNAYGEKCAGRCFGITEQGNMGMFLNGTREGDFVCLFPGSRLPFNIRQVATKQSGGDAHYELIGPAYVQNFMDGVVLPPGTVMENILLR